MENFMDKLVELFTTPQYIESLLHGFVLTMQISFFAIIIGLILGTIIALVDTAPKSGWMILPKFVCKIYTTVIRGTPMALQLFIMFFVIFAIRGFPQIVTAILAFGLNSGAYVAEVIRSGIQSVDNGQTEAGLALGLSRSTVFRKIVAPQAIKTLYLR